MTLCRRMIWLAALAGFWPFFAHAQTYTLEQVIDLAKRQSPAYYQAVNSREVRYWAFRAYKAQFLPQVLLQGTVPDYNRAFAQIQQPDGSFLPNFLNQSNSDLNVFVNQNIGATGTRLFANSSLRRFDNLLPNLPLGVSRLQYTGSPFVLGVQQKLLGFIPLRWDQKIEPLRFEESKRAYAEELEAIAVRATERFFDLLLAQMSLRIAEQNRTSTDTIVRIAQGRYNLGKIGQDELLQLELTLMRAEQEVAQSRSNIETASLNLRRFIGLTDGQPIDLAPPGSLPNLTVAEPLAVEQARANRQNPIAFNRQLLEAQRGIAQARSDAGFNLDLFGTFGLSNQAQELTGLYRNPNNQINLNVGFSIPLVTWGRNQALRKTAEANYELTKNVVAQAEQNFEQEVVTQVRQLRVLREQVLITQKSDQIGQQRYEISRNRYLIGKISITDLNIALQEKDQARRSQVDALRQFWRAYHELRRLTLYDFELGQPLIDKK
jgi:outer membrane protein